MGSWALRAALLCLGGALVCSQFHSLPHRDGLIPARGQATTQEPKAKTPEEEEPVTKDCGIAPLKGAMEGSRIIGGTRATIGAWPWLVSLQVQDGNFLVHICGGALVRDRWVLTAAHCTKEASDPFKWRAVIGANDLSQSSTYVRNIRVVAIVIQPDFILETFVNDIALFRLRKAVRYNDYIQPICLPFDVFQKLDQNTSCFISGWGRTKEEGNGTNILQEAKVHFISREICNSKMSYGGVIPNTSFCAGHENGTFDTCRGDSGGPLMCYLPEHKRYFVMGITSYGHGCGRRHFPGVYSSPSFFKQWLTEHLSQGSTTRVFNMDMVRCQILMALGAIILLGVT
ncbi:transmembrane protease serine 12 [Cricetulus griseus]|uniref:Transmembrane protease serine 12 n=1 Tax=Cricetulus griseus TaxID=10029 RepID=A0A9J7F9X3_CRIGR|nr:transmembrane protease serine 12 [Cricetulus griseus]XP_027251823.1 transmembrane protease serine 12 [Cricetulus griseus]